MTLGESISLISLLVSAGAAFYAYRAPIRAVERAEEIRKAASEIEEKRALFDALMMLRGSWISPDMTVALNRTKAVFRDSKEVGDCWHALWMASATGQNMVKLYSDLLRAMAGHLKIDLRSEDIEQYFINGADNMEQTLRSHHLREAMNRLNSIPSSATSPDAGRN